jgi:ABC-type branched-subunit amino acid transport system permease subunit
VISFLRPLHYRFRVIACNNNGVWNNVGADVEFTITPAWFQTYWFFALCAAAVFFIVWVLYRMRVPQVADAIAVRFDERLAERTRIARDFRIGLTSNSTDM